MLCTYDRIMPHGIQPAIMRTCRQVYEEAMHIIYPLNKFGFTCMIGETSTRSLGSKDRFGHQAPAFDFLSSESLSLVQNITIDVTNSNIEYTPELMRQLKVIEDGVIVHCKNVKHITIDFWLYHLFGSIPVGIHLELHPQQRTSGSSKNNLSLDDSVRCPHLEDGQGDYIELWCESMPKAINNGELHQTTLGIRKILWKQWQ